jgi:hypothetical protein
VLDQGDHLIVSSKVFKILLAEELENELENLLLCESIRVTKYVKSRGLDSIALPASGHQREYYATQDKMSQPSPRLIPSMCFCPLAHFLVYNII